MEKNIPLIIANTYKIIGQIGSGGGGDVYLGEHLRLDKKVVLKADRRSLSANPEVLRREVDALKNLNHTYIPQVYDFIEENGVVYTIMNFIDGESFDKPLKRGERYTQAQAIEWGCKLLDALIYLHSRPPHGILHADIKPANVMLTSQGDVRLIDFNIALALGEEGAIAVGRSFGYASPEHYGMDHSVGNTDRGTTPDTLTILTNDVGKETVTELQNKPQLSSSSSASSKKTILLDVRSDIYSLGATLYHIMTGERPAHKATDVTKISETEYSPAVISIITKAMNPNPDLRYQSAKEMLSDFEHLHDNDSRTKRHKKTTIMATVFFVLLLLTGSFTTFVGLKQMEQLQNAFVMAEYSQNALSAGDVILAIDYALQALPEKSNVFTPPRTAEAQKALTDALNVYDLSDVFKAYRTVKLPSAPLYMEISPSGKTAACVYAYNVAIVNTTTADVITTLSAERSALSEVKYINENTIVYAGNDGICVYDIDKNMEIWRGKHATSITTSADGKIVAAIYKDEGTATVYDLKNGSVIYEVNFLGKHQRITVNDSFANPRDNLFTLNRDGTLLGVSFSDGSLWVYDLVDSKGDLEIFDNTSGYTHFEGGFFGQYFSFSATHTDGSIFAIIDTVNQEQTGGFESEIPFGVQVDDSGVYVQTGNLLVNIDPVTGEQKGIVNTVESIERFAYSSGNTLITTKDEYIFFDKNANLVVRYKNEYSSDFIKISNDTALIGSLDAPVLRILKMEKHPDAEVFSYDPEYVHDEARLSLNDKTVMLFSFKRFRLCNLNGDIIADVSIPNADQLYDQQYRRDERGSRLDLIYNDGRIATYSAKDGSLLSEASGKKPDLSLYEEFFTDSLRIESPLHGVPIAYDRKSGKLVRELEKDAYLTYVSQIGEYVITEYVTAEGKRYGLLLNEQCETLAYLPYLCDIVGEELIFDYPTGELRKSRIHSINELIELARKLIII